MENTEKSFTFTNSNKEIKVNSDPIFKPLISYLYYVLIRVVKSMSTIIIISLTMIVALLLSIAPSWFEGTDKVIVMRFIPILLSIMLIIFASTFGVSKSMQLFHEFQTEGTELIVVSKPISRTHILISKFGFLFILGLIYTALITIMCTIGFSVVGFDEYAASGITAAGIFGATTIAYMIMGLISIAICISTDNSAKLAKTLPSIVLSVSAMACTIVPQLVTTLNQNPSDAQIKRLFIKINEDISTSGLTIKGEPVTALATNSFQKPFVYDAKGKFIYIGESINVHTGTSIKPAATIKTSDFSIKKEEKPSQEIQDIYSYVIDVAMTEFKTNGLESTGQGWTAFNYLNPVSAFMSISGTDISSFTGFRSLPYNYNLSEFSSAGITNNETYEFPNTIKVGKAVQLDAPWAIAVLWGSVFIGLGIFTVIAYNRKDFK
ncbi:MAG: ABC transporter permease [Mycoplasma sp.]